MQKCWPMSRLSTVKAHECRSLAGKQLRGNLPVSWSQLKNLTLLDLQNNALTGTLPPQWSELQHLQTLTVKNNALNGTLPSQWSS